MSRRQKTNGPGTTSAAVDPLRNDLDFARPAAGIFALALVVRLAHAWFLSRSPFFHALLGDAHGYDEWARRIAGGEWIGTDVFYQAPLYPYFLGVVYKLFGHNLGAVRVVQAVVGAASCGLLGLAGDRFFSRTAGIVAGCALALYAPAIFFDALIQKSVLDLFFLTLSLWLIGRLVDDAANRVTWFALGLAMGGLSLTRENALVFVAVIAGWALLRRTTAGRVEGPRVATRALWAGTFAAGLLVVLVPVAVRNYAVGGGFYLTTSQFGPNFYIGNNPKADGTYASLRFGRGAPEYERTDATELAEHALGRSLTPSEVSTYWTDRALDFIAHNPGAWLRLMLRKGLLLFNASEVLDTEAQESHAEWSPILRAGGVVGHFGVLAPVAFAGMLIAWRDRRRLAVLYVMTAAYAASVLMFYVFARYRLPLVPIFVLFAAAAAVGINQWLRAAQTPARIRLAVAALAVAVFANWPVLEGKASVKAITETNLAVALQADGRNDDAIAHYRRALEIQPDYAPAWNNLGVVQRATGHVDEAIASYEKALSLAGEYPDAHYNLANALLDRNRPQEAAEHFRIALQSIPDAAGVSNNLGIALAAQNRQGDAVAAFRAAVAADPNSPIAHRNLADALSSAGLINESVSEYRRAIQLAPADAAAHYNLGVVLLQSNQLPGALTELREAVRLSPQSADAHNNLGIALGSTGDLQGAIAEFRRALAINPDATDAQRNLQMAEQARAQAQGQRR